MATTFLFLLLFPMLPSGTIVSRVGKFLKFLFTLLAKDAAPIRLANALPRRAVAVAVLAARIRHALVAKFTFPAVSAPVCFQ